MSDGADFRDAVDLTSLIEIVESLPHAAVLLSMQGDVVSENSAFRFLRHHTGSEIPADNFFSTLKPADQTEIARMMESDASDRRRRYKLDWQIPGSTVTTHRAEMTLLSDGEAAAVKSASVSSNPALANANALGPCGGG